MSAPDTDRLPPHSIEAEKGVLGCIMDCPRDCLPESVDRLRPGHLVFYDLRHQTLFHTLCRMMEDGEPVDLITVQQRLKNKGMLEEVGGLAYLCTLPDAIPSAANLSYYLDIVLEKYMLRKLVQTCAGIVGRVFDREDQPEGLMEEVERDVLDIRASVERGRGVSDLMEVHQKLIAKYELAFGGYETGLLTGFHDLDRMTGGMQPQEMIVLAGQQSTGKTSLLMNIAWNVVQSGGTAGILSLETSTEKLLHRLYASVGRLNGSRFLRASNLTEPEMKGMLTASERVLRAKNRILIDEGGGATVGQMKAKARRLFQRGASFVGIDYMQLLNAPDSDGDTARVTAISRAIKECAKENDRPVIAISSLNRDAAKGERKPRTSDLRGSGQIEYDGNQVWLMDSEDTDSLTRNVSLKVAKSKDTATGEINLLFFPSQFRFEDAAKIAPEDHPNYMKD